MANQFVESPFDKGLLAEMKKYAGKGKYKVGDSIESVAWREAQLDLIAFCEKTLKKGVTAKIK